jgi:amidase
MHLETVNNITGRTLNPINRELSAGGSSGGESALVAFKGSPIGLAADGGGSIRNPAANCGLIGMKCTSNRVPQAGSKAPMFGNECTPVSVGPVCHSVRDNIYFLKAMLDTQPWLREPYLTPVPWRPVVLKPKYRIGVVTDDGLVKPHPPVLAAIKALSQKLSSLGDFEVFPFSPYEHARGYDIVRRIYFCDGGAANRSIIASSGEPVCDLSEWIMKPEIVVPHTIESLWAAQAERNKFRQDYLDHWNNHPDAPDFLLVPVGFGVATRHDTARYWGYTAIYNLLDYPACAFPTGMTVSAENEEHKVDRNYVARENEFEKYCTDLYTEFGPEGYEGAPISLQLVGRKYDCEAVMETVARIMEVVKSGI